METPTIEETTFGANPNWCGECENEHYGDYGAECPICPFWAEYEAAVDQVRANHLYKMVSAGNQSVFNDTLNEFAAQGWHILRFTMGYSLVPDGGSGESYPVALLWRYGNASQDFNGTKLARLCKERDAALEAYRNAVETLPAAATGRFRTVAGLGPEKPDLRASEISRGVDSCTSCTSCTNTIVLNGGGNTVSWQITLAVAHAAAVEKGYKPTRLGSRERFSFNSAACHIGGDNPAGCWATEREGRVYFHCHKHGDGKSQWIEAHRRITANLGLPEYRAPSGPYRATKPISSRTWTYHNPTTGEGAVQVVERYDGPCQRDDCREGFAHKHSWLRRKKEHRETSTDGFLLLEHMAPEGAPAVPEWAIVAEGEKTAEAAAELGWRAFSYLGGSNGAGRADYSPVRGLNMLIAPDNDRPGMKAALIAAIRCLEAGAIDVRLMPTDVFTRRGEDLADLESSERGRAVETGWFAEARPLERLVFDLAVHNLEERCRAATKRPLIEASDREHLDLHVEQTWRGILDREGRAREPQLFRKEGRLVYLSRGYEGELVIADHTRDSIAIVAAAAVYWYQGFKETVLTDEPAEEAGWIEAAALLDGIDGVEHGRVAREERRGRMRYILRTPRPRHPQRSVTGSLLIDPPEELPELEAVIDHPFLGRAGDRLITEQGYHPAERMYLQNPLGFTPMPVDKAVSELDDLFCDFPFATRSDRTNLYASIVTKICRRSYPIAPLVMIDKPKSGTGATLMAEMVSVLTTGQMPLRATYCNGEQLEFEKRIAATGYDANGVLLMDNLVGVLSSPMLSDLLTSGVYDARDLGRSRNFRIDTRNLLMMATSNNVSMAAELVNRTLHIRLDAGLERPDRRTAFRHPAVTDYLRNHLEIKRNAALSLVHHWLELGKPDARALPEALRRFPAWHRQTAAIMEAAGLPDFAANANEFEERAVSDAEAAVHPFIQWWWDTHQGNPVGVKDLAPMALGDPSDEDSEGMLRVSGSTDKQRRSALSKTIKKWIHQTFELDGVVVRVTSGPLYKNRYPTWMLQTPDAKAGGFPLDGLQTNVLVQEVQEVQESTPREISEALKSGFSGPRPACRGCGNPLLPDENGPDCENCSSIGKED